MSGSNFSVSHDHILIEEMSQNNTPNTNAQKPSKKKNTGVLQRWVDTEIKYFLCIMSKHYKELKTAKTTNEKGIIWDKISDKHCEKYPHRSK